MRSSARDRTSDQGRRRSGASKRRLPRSVRASWIPLLEAHFQAKSELLAYGMCDTAFLMSVRVLTRAPAALRRGFGILERDARPDCALTAAAPASARSSAMNS